MCDQHRDRLLNRLTHLDSVEESEQQDSEQNDLRGEGWVVVVNRPVRRRHQDRRQRELNGLERKLGTRRDRRAAAGGRVVAVGTLPQHY